MGIKDKKREHGISRRKPGARAFSEHRENLAETPNYQQQFFFCWSMRTFCFNQTHLYDLNFLLFSLMDLCECRRTIENVLRDKTEPADELEIELGAGFI